MILGTDHYWRDWTIPDGNVYSPPNWKTQIANGVRFTWLKAADGIESSLHFDKAFQDARADGLFVGAYVWLDARNYADPKRQAEFWYSVLKDLNCPVSIDFELYRDNVPDWRDLYDATMYYLALDPNRNVGVYTNYWYWIAHGSTDPVFNRILKFNWSARYFTQPPQLYAPFNRTDIWQFSGLGDPFKYGITNGKEAVDENWWMGDEESLIKFFNQDGTVPPIEPPIEPPTGETMELTSLENGLRIRTGPGTSYPQVTVAPTYLDKGQTAEVFELSGTEGATQWARIGESRWTNVWYNGYHNAQLSGIIVPPAGFVTVDIYANGAAVHSKQVSAGGSVRIDITD